MVRWWRGLGASGVAECWVPGSDRATCWSFRKGLTAARPGGRAPCKPRSWCLRQASPSRWPKASDAGGILMSRLKLWFLIVLLFAGSVTVLSLTESAATSDPSPAANKDSAAIQTVKMPDAPALPETERESGVLPPGTDPQNTLGWSFVKHLASDQKAFWKSGRDLGRGDAKAVGAFAGFTALLIASDSCLAKQVPDKPSQLRRSNHLSQYAAYSLAGAVGGSFFWGHLTKNDHLRETGLLSGEALLNSTAATYAFRGITQRARPFEGDGTGKFFQRGSSFPSEHSVDAWSVASVMAHE